MSSWACLAILFWAHNAEISKMTRSKQDPSICAVVFWHQQFTNWAITRNHPDIDKRDFCGHEIDHDQNCDHDHGILALLRMESQEVLFAQPLVRTVLPNMLRHKSKSARLQSATPKILWLCCRIILLLSFFWKWEITQTCVRRFYQQLTPLCNMLSSFCGLCCSNGSQSSGNDVYSDLFPIMFCICNRPTHVLWKSFQVRAFHELHTCADSWAEKISESNWSEVKSTSEC